VYGFAGGDPVNFADPFGLSPCSDLVKSLERQAKLFIREYRKYKYYHNKGLSNEGHYQELTDFRQGVRTRLDQYDDNHCDDDDDGQQFQRVVERSRSVAETEVPEPRQQQEIAPSSGPSPIPPPTAAGAAATGLFVFIARALFVLIIG
jgi:hypothetical protein